MPGPTEQLIAAARAARERAYAPYSGYRVGAAVRDSSDAIHSGANVENASFGLTICAERSAVFRMASAGGREIVEVAVATSDGVAPCGACLQVLLEFTSVPELVTIHCVSETGAKVQLTLAELMPHGFRSASVRRTANGQGAV